MVCCCYLQTSHNFVGDSSNLREDEISSITDADFVLVDDDSDDVCLIFYSKNYQLSFISVCCQPQIRIETLAIER